MSIIDFGALEKPMKEIEGVLVNFNEVEQDLILREVFKRFNDKVMRLRQKEKATGLVRELLPGFMKG